MSMFSGFTNQISGWVATKTGHPHPEHEVDPNAEQQPIQEQMEAPENGGAEMMLGEEAVEGHTPTGGVSGFAKGLMQKGMSIKENMKEKASALNPHNLHGIGSNLMGGITNLIPGRKEEEVPTPPEPQATNEMGGDMMVEGEQQEYQQE